MLTPREFDQLHLALFAMAKTRINGVVVVDYEHTMILLKSFTEGTLEITVDQDNKDTLNVQFTPPDRTSPPLDDLTNELRSNE